EKEIEIDTELDTEIETDIEDLVEEEDARAGDPMYDPGFGKVMTYFMDQINSMPSPIAIGEIQFYLHAANLDPDVIIHAMQIAVDEKKTSWSYIRAILQRYANSGLNTMSLVLSSEQQFEQQKASAAQAPQKRSSKGESAVSDLLSLHRRYEEQP
ncbi:MAG: DnaD domain protein, partial [Oscillospiraceae bacterium]|nr:DnaD domain protein [Oscillospiraceae bacterium]